MATRFKPKMSFWDTWKSMVEMKPGSSNQWKSIGIDDLFLMSMKSMVPGPESLTSCGNLGHPVAGDWVPLANLCRLGGLRSSDHQLLGSSDGQFLEIISGQISEHQLFGSAARG